MDRAFARFNLGVGADYAAFLLAHAEAFIPAEAALDRFGAEQLIADWPRRRRASALCDDLAALGRGALAGPALTLHDDAAAWGALYVLEGSRLGGALLVRAVPEGLPTAYLAAPQPQGGWRTMLKALDLALDQHGGCEAAIDAAVGIFARFEHAAMRAGKLTR